MKFLFESLTNLSPVSSVLLTAVVAILVILLGSRLWSFFATPGPWGLPIIGYYPFLREDLHVQLNELAKRHGSVFVINLLGVNFVHFDNMEALKEAHVNKIDDFARRSNEHGVLQYPLKDGLFYLEGDMWKVHRKFFVQTMRELGATSSKEEFKGPIGDAIRSMLDELSELGGQPFEAINIMNKKCGIIVMKFMLGDQVSENVVFQLVDAYLKVLTPLTSKNMLLTGSVAKYFVLPFTPDYKGMIEGHDVMVVLLHQCLEEHKKTYDVSEQPRDFIEHYLQEKDLKEKKNDPTCRFYTDTALVYSLIQFVGDGSVTSGSFIANLLRVLTKHRDVQDVVHREIVQVVGTERLPNWEDRGNLPLTNAAIKECMRHETMFSLFLGLECTRETTIQGVRIPKGSVTIANNWLIHNDPNVFDNPEKFDIDRYLPDKPKVVQPLLFGIGKRACAGESFVMAQAFLFIAVILQKFILLPENDVAHPDEIDALSLDTSLKLRAIPRTES